MAWTRGRFAARAGDRRPPAPSAPPTTPTPSASRNLVRLSTGRAAPATTATRTATRNSQTIAHTIRTRRLSCQPRLANMSATSDSIWIAWRPRKCATRMIAMLAAPACAGQPRAAVRRADGVCARDRHAMTGPRVVQLLARRLRHQAPRHGADDRDGHAEAQGPPDRAVGEALPPQRHCDRAGGRAFESGWRGP